MNAFREVCIAVYLVFGFAIPVLAADITVNEDCSLADAIKAANDDHAIGGCSAGNAADVITLTADVHIQSALPLVTSKLTIEGDGLSIVGNGRTHIIGVNSRGELTLNDLTIRNGRSAWGGAIGNLGGKLTITRSRIFSNSAVEGGAIDNEGTLAIKNSTVKNNNSEDNGGAIHNLGGSITIKASDFISNMSEAWGGAIYNDNGSVTIDEGSVFSQNSAKYLGGALNNDEGSVTIKDSTFLSNIAGTARKGSGGAIYNFVNWQDDKMAISSSSFVQNSAIADGGAIDNATGDLEIVNSSYVGNTSGRNGGAISNSNKGDSKTIRFSTFYRNSAGNDGGGVYVESSDVDIMLTNSIIAGSKAGGDCYGRLAVNVRNLIEDGSCYAELSGNPQLGDIVELEVGIHSYVPPLAGSSIIDAANCEESVETDQVGTTRPQGEACDIGAIEYVHEE